MKRVILDMDPGVDDALAIILAMLSPELKVEAITTVSGNVRVDQCMRNVRRILEVLKPDTPPIIAKGHADPMITVEPLPNTSDGNRITSADVHGSDGLGDVDRLVSGDGVTKRYPEPSLYAVSSDHAVDVILSLAADHPGEITLIPTGPLTNIAAAVIQDIERMRKIKEIIIMGGAFRVPGNVTAAAEFNIFFDPHAADVVVKSGLPITFVGLDVTRQVLLRRSYVEQEVKPLNTQLAQFICDVTGVYMDFHRKYYGFDGCYMHDPLAIGTVIKPDIVQSEEIHVQVETQGNVTSGMTVADLRRMKSHKPTPNVRVCTNVDADRFLTLFWRTINGIAHN